MKKYELILDQSIDVGVRLYRIRAIESFGNVCAGKIGGYVQSESSLSHDGNAWVYGNAQVSGDARVYGNAQVSGDARVYGNAWVYGDARVYGNAQVSGDAQVYGNAQVSGNAQVYGNTRVYGNAQVYGNAWVYGDARVSSTDDYLTLGPLGSRSATLTAFRCESGWMVSTGCFLGSPEEFMARVIETHGDNKHARLYRAAVEMAAYKFGETP